MRLYLILGTLCLALGAALGWRFKPSPAPIIHYRDDVKERIITRTIKEPNGNEVVVRDEVRSTSRSEAKPNPVPAKPQYRLGALLPVGVGELKPTVTTGRRIFGNVWLDAQYNMSRKEASVGISLEL